MNIIREMYLAGKTIMTREKPSYKCEKGMKRAPKQNITSEAVWKNNLKNAIFNLTLVLNHNFVPGDHHLQLTYEIEPTLEQGKKDRAKFTRKLKSECKKNGIDIKWVAVSEYSGKRLHHHIVCTNCPMEIINKCWPHGMVFHNPLWDNPNYKDLASYLLKEATKLHESEEKIFKRRYNTSRNIVIPEPEQPEELSRVDLDDEPKPFKGYYIDGEVERYEHFLTRLTCREYVQVSLTAKPRIKKWNTHKPASAEKINYTKLLSEAYNERQESFLGDIL